MYTWQADLLKFLGSTYTISYTSRWNCMLENLIGLLVVAILLYLMVNGIPINNTPQIHTCPRPFHYHKSIHIIKGKNLLQIQNGRLEILVLGNFAGAKKRSNVVHCEYLSRQGWCRRTLPTMRFLTRNCNRNKFANLIGGNMELPKDFARNGRFIDKLTALTPAEFVRLDKEQQMRSLQTTRCIRSLTSIFNNVVHKRFDEPQRRGAKKEYCSCMPSTQVLMQFLDSERATDSLIHVLNDIIEDTNAENPLPFSGELTALVCDIGNNHRERGNAFLDYPNSTPSSTTTTVSEVGYAT